VYLTLPVAEIDDKDFAQLVQEMIHASGIQLVTQSFVPFLISCQHPDGGGTARIPFRPARTFPGLLETRIDKITSNSIQELCQEVAATIDESLEMHANTKLMTFLIYVVRALEKKSKRSRRRR
jgi:hypothetical protein